jgi:hypothetical protein
MRVQKSPNYRHLLSGVQKATEVVSASSKLPMLWSLVVGGERRSSALADCCNTPTGLLCSLDLADTRTWYAVPCHAMMPERSFALLQVHFRHRVNTTIARIVPDRR